MNTISESYECLGNKKCPLGPKNKYREWCKICEPCLDAFILRRLRTGYSPLRLMRELKEVCRKSTDYNNLLRIGLVAQENGIEFGVKTIRTAIENSDIPGDDEGDEARIIRKAFGVYGRKKALAPARIGSIGTIDEGEMPLERVAGG
jgi:hypothetical protein